MAETTRSAAQRAAKSGPRPAIRRGGRLRPDPCGVVIFGASGDLTARKLMPALYDLFHLGEVANECYVVGAARTDWSDEKFRQVMRDAIEKHGRCRPQSDTEWERFARRLSYVAIDAKSPDAYQRLAKRLKELDAHHGAPGNYLFYLAVAPGLYPVIVEQMGPAGLAAGSGSGHGWSRIIFEKPFGRDRASARELNQRVRQVFEESQIYRIDHYLGKETVQNLSVFRFANGIFEPIWNRSFIDHVQITVAEDLGVEQRAGFYETAGAARDMIQNHMLQLVCQVAMEPPAAFEADAVRAEKLKVLQTIRPLTGEQARRVAVRGQYGPGRLDGREVPGYRQESKVAPHSTTETFVALRLDIANWRWAGVPFYLRTGKRLPRKTSQISIQFRDAPLHLFACTPMGPCEPNVLHLRIQPDEGIDLHFIAKQPGLKMVGESVKMDFSYGGAFEQESPTAYETLLLDALQGDPLLFAHGDWIEQAWGILDPLLDAWAKEQRSDFPNYAAGSWGPQAADELLARDGRRWHLH